MCSKISDEHMGHSNATSRAPSTPLPELSTAIAAKDTCDMCEINSVNHLAPHPSHHDHTEQLGIQEENVIILK